MIRVLGRRLKSEARLWRSSALPGVMVIGGVALARLMGWLQPLEWMAFDRMLLLRPAEPMDERIVIIGIDENDLRKLNTYPVPDGVLARLMTQLQGYGPSAIGLDIVRDIPVQPGHDQLSKIFQSQPNVFAIEQILDAKTGSTVRPPATILPNQVGFSDLLLDRDGYLRRSLLNLNDLEGRSKFSLVARLADRHLHKIKGIELDNAKPPYDESIMQLGNTILPQFTSHTGGYVGTDAGGYQMLLNVRSGPKPFRMLSLRDMQAGRFKPEWIRNRIVLIGITAISVKDVVNSAAVYSTNPGLVNGVELHAHGVSQLVSAVLDDRPLLRTWTDGWEYLWIVAWGLVGILVGRVLSASGVAPIFLGVGVACLSLGVICGGLLLVGWWVPIVPAMMALILNGAGLTAALFYRYDHGIRARLKDRQQVIDQTFDAIHNGPLQRLARLLREAQENPNSFPPPAILELNLLNRELREVNDAIRKETLHQTEGFYFSSDLDLDLQLPLHEVLQQVYANTLDRDFPGFRTIKVCLPEFSPIDDRKLTLEQKRSLCRFLEEALCNVGKHAVDATKLWVFCGTEAGKRVIRVQDNGVPDQGALVSNEGRGLGTRQAKTLAKQIKGAFRRWDNQPQGMVCELVW